MGDRAILHFLTYPIWDILSLNGSGFASGHSNLEPFLHWHAFFLMMKKKIKMKITLQDFQYASFEKKCDVVTSYSNFLSTRLLGECKVYLYHTDHFFIEVFYSPQLKKVLMIQAFNNVAGLEPYAEMVSLADLNL